jgi:hypothetical protein
LLHEGFKGIHGLSVASNPEGSEQPGYDAFASVAMTYVGSINETLLCVLLKERFAEFGGPPFLKILTSLVGLRKWDFGYAFANRSRKSLCFMCWDWMTAS